MEFLTARVSRFSITVILIGLQGHLEYKKIQVGNDQKKAQ